MPINPLTPPIRYEMEPYGAVDSLISPPQPIRGHPKYGGWKTPSCDPSMRPHGEWEGAVLLQYRFFRTSPRCLPIWWGVLLDAGHSVVLMGLPPGVLWSLDTVPAIAYPLGGFSGGVFRAIKFVARRVGVTSYCVKWRACVLGFPHHLY